MAAKYKYDESTRLEAVRLKNSGLTVTEVATRLNLPRPTVNRWIAHPAASPEPTPAAQSLPRPDTAARLGRLEMENAALRQQARVAAVASDRPPVTCAYTAPEVSERDKWLAAEQVNAEKIKKELEQSKFNLNQRNEDRPIAAVFVSDQHICTGQPVDLKRMREDAELMAATDGVFAFLVGDGVDNHLKHRSAMLASRCPPSEQWRMYDFYLSIFAHRIAAMIAGNHDQWLEFFGGVDMVQRLAKENRICYAPNEAFISVDMREHSKSIAMRHQYRLNSSFNQTHANKQWHRNGEALHDIYVIGHHHDPAIEEARLHGEFRIFARPGSYQLTSSYSQTFGFNSTTPTCPTVLIWPEKEERMMFFPDLRQGIKVLRKFR